LTPVIINIKSFTNNITCAELGCNFVTLYFQKRIKATFGLRRLFNENTKKYVQLKFYYF